MKVGAKDEVNVFKVDGIGFGLVGDCLITVKSEWMIWMLSDFGCILLKRSLFDHLVRIEYIKTLMQSAVEC